MMDESRKKNEKRNELASELKTVGDLIRAENHELALQMAKRVLLKAEKFELEDFMSPAKNIIESIKIIIKNKQNIVSNMVVKSPELPDNAKKLENLEISLDDMEYDKKEKRISIKILGFTFIGQFL